MTHSDILKKWPSAPQLAKDVGRPKGTVANWIGRNSIPVKHWPAVVAAAKKRGIKVSLEDLARAATKKVA